MKDISVLMVDPFNVERYDLRAAIDERVHRGIQYDLTDYILNVGTSGSFITSERTIKDAIAQDIQDQMNAR